MAIAGGNITLDSTEGMDRISQTEKVTSPYFSNGGSTLLAASIVSSSLTDTNETYFFGISNSATPTVEEFNVAFGSTRGFGANVETGTKSETEAIYKQYSNLLLAPTEVTGGFFISSPGSTSAVASGRDTEIFVMSARRSNMKDRINKGTWTIALSGSTSAVLGDAGATLLELTDDSVNSNPTATPVGDRYNIVSGSAGTVKKTAAVTNFGFFYPDMGIMVFSAAELSASIPGTSGSTALSGITVFDTDTQKGFGFSSDTNSDEKTALRFINCLQPTGAKLTFRDEEDQVSAQYFCRVRSGQMNFSNNPTFVSGSLNELRQSTMRSNPTTFISSVQLYNRAGEMIGVGNLSTPLKKNFTSEATIKVKLTY
tara:strand:+ start:896 stop:2005 length:1110 start_codon:yes stop_codon:yes gene_type:complete